ncbi:unnamed protein product [Urochloa humidicola]
MDPHPTGHEELACCARARLLPAAVVERMWPCVQTEWELRGLDRDHAPTSFDLGVSGSLYADRSLRGRRAGCRMRGHLEIAITVVLPPPLRLVPESVLRGVAESVLSRLAEKMKRDVDVGLIADFQRFRREKAAAAAASMARPTLDEA